MDTTLERKIFIKRRAPSRVSTPEKRQPMKHYDVSGLMRMSREGLEKSIKEDSTPGWTRVI